MTSSFPIDTYLQRIGLASLPEATPEGLKQLVRAQNLSIAFENLDVLAQLPISLERDAIVDKILHRGRGGYCFELNGLLGAALEAAGFELRRALARVTYRRTEPGPLTHLVHLVNCDGRQWLVDAGFGGPGLIEPALFELDNEWQQNGARFRLIADAHGDVHLQRLIDDEWAGLCQISPRPVLPVDLQVANHFVSHYERSPFRNIFICARPTADGLAIIHQDELLVLDEQQSPLSRIKIRDGGELAEIMRTRFDVAVSDEVAAKAWDRVMRVRE